MAKVQTRKGKRGTSYRVEFTRGGFRVSKTFQLKKDAEKYAASITLNNELADSLANKTLKNLTLEKAVLEYLEQHTGKDTNVAYRLNWWVKVLGANRPIGQIERQDIKRVLSSMINDGKSTATHNRYKCAISSVFEYIKDEYDTNHNPARLVKQLKEGRSRERYASEAELSRLFDASKQSKWERLYLLVLMAVSTGARRSELLNLRWTDIDIRTKTAYLGDTKNGEARVLPLTEACINELNQFREVGSGLLFPHPQHNVIPFTNFDKYWYDALKHAGITGLVFHGLRHTTGSHLAKNGVPMSVIKEILGHKTILTTQRYVHHDTNQKAAAINNVFGKVM